MSRIQVRVLVPLVAATLVGCASLNVGHSDLTVEDDCEFSETVTVKGTPREHATGDFFFLRSFVPCGEGTVRHQLYMEDNYSNGWRHYERARLEGGTRLDVTRISSDVDCSGYGCSYEEHVGVDLDKVDLDAYREDGFRVRIYAQSGHEKDITVPGTLVEQQLVTADSIQAAGSR